MTEAGKGPGSGTGKPASSVVASGSDACALLTDGTAECWGDDSNGQLGVGISCPNGPFALCPTTPIVVPGLSGATAITFPLCALVGGGTVECLGTNPGDGGVGFVPMNGLTNVSAISAGESFTCALASGAVSCWGDNSYGELGNGSLSSSATPMSVSGLSGVTAISAGYQYACALMQDGSVQCWGDNGGQQLGNANATVVCGGNGSDACSQTPVPVTGLTGVKSLAAGFVHTCALKTDGSVVCWGTNSHGQLGSTNGDESTSPIAVQGLMGTVKTIVAGEFHTCALMTDGTVDCWGLNNNGQLGATSCSDGCLPTPVPGVSGVTSIALGTFYTCAILSSGSVECWGSGNYGLLGNGLTTTNSPAPVVIPL